MFRICSDFESIRIIQGIFSFFTIGCALAVLYFSIAAYHDTKRDFRGLEFDDVFIAFVSALAIAAIVLSFALLAFNVKRFFNFVLAFGVCLVLVALLALFLSAISYRKVKYIDDKYNGKECKPHLISIPESDLASTSCKSKYINKAESPYLPCSMGREVIGWEEGESKAKSFCLNFKCCDVMKEWMSREQLNLFLAISALVVYSLLSGGLCYYLSSVPYKVRVSYKLYIDYFFMALSLVAIIAGGSYLIAFYRKDIVNSDKPIYTSTQTYEKFSQSSDYLPKVCVGASTLQTKPLDFGSHSPDDIFIVALEVINGKFSMDPYHEYPKVNVFDDSAKTKLFPASPDKEYIVFEANAFHAIEFFTKQLKICPKSAQLVVTLKSFVHNKSIKKNVFMSIGSRSIETIEALTAEEQAILDSQKELDLVKFGEVYLTVHSLRTGEPFDEVNLWIFSQSVSCKIHPHEDIFVNLHKANGTGTILHNMPYQTITVFAMKEGHYSNCHSFLVHKESMTLDLIVLDKGDDDARILLKWEDPSIILSLFSSFEYNRNRPCRTSVYDTSCLHSTLNTKSFASNQYQTLNINFGEKQYFFYVKEVINAKQKEDRDKAKENLNEKFFNSNTRLMYYVKELDFPLQESSFPFDFATFQTAVKDPNLAMLFACVDATKSDKLMAIEKLWVTGMKLGTKVVKNEWQQFPENSFCNDYRQSIEAK